MYRIDDADEYRCLIGFAQLCRRAFFFVISTKSEHYVDT